MFSSLFSPLKPKAEGQNLLAKDKESKSERMVMRNRVYRPATSRICVFLVALRRLTQRILSSLRDARLNEHDQLDYFRMF